MIYYLMLLLSFNVFAAQPTHWANLFEVSDRHEFYENHESIVKPKDSWQTLFGLVYIDRNLQRIKDCVFFRVPGHENGILKIKTIPAQEKCDEHLLKDGDREFVDVKSLQFAVFEHELKIDMSFADFRTEKWMAKFQSSFNNPGPEMGLSSAEFKSPKLILLAPAVNSVQVTRKAFPPDNTLCHDINEDCEELKPSSCNDCQNGWYEIPNGCSQSPKFCGILQCGKKDQPACRRGLKWQRKEISADCRVDSSFAYCSKGLAVHCEGKRAFCR